VPTRPHLQSPSTCSIACDRLYTDRLAGLYLTFRDSALPAALTDLLTGNRRLSLWLAAGNRAMDQELKDRMSINLLFLAAPRYERRQQNPLFHFLGPRSLSYCCSSFCRVYRVEFKFDAMGRSGHGAWVGLKTSLLCCRPIHASKSLGHLFLMFVPGPIILTLALFFAFNLPRHRGARLFRIAFFFPNVISSSRWRCSGY